MTLLNFECCSWCYLDLSLLAGLGAEGSDDVTVVTPDFLIIHLQTTLIPTSHWDVRVHVSASLLEVHDFIPEACKHSRERVSAQI